MQQLLQALCMPAAQQAGPFFGVSFPGWWPVIVVTSFIIVVQYQREFGASVVTFLPLSSGIPWEIVMMMIRWACSPSTLSSLPPGRLVALGLREQARSCSSFRRRCMSSSASQHALGRHESTLDAQERPGIRSVSICRPSSFNSLDASTARDLENLIQMWDPNYMIRAMVVLGEDAGSFCSGADIESLARRGAEGDGLIAAVARLAWRVHHCRTPIISIVDGVVADGGCALMHGAYSIATEEAKFYVGAPMVGMALDGGLSYKLSRCLGAGHSLGLFIALTGSMVKGENLVASGIATHFMPSMRKEGFLANLELCTGSSMEGKQEIENAIRTLVFEGTDVCNKRSGHARGDLFEDGPETMTGIEGAGYLQIIRKIFEAPSFAKLIERLNSKAGTSNMAKQALSDMRKSSPLALKVIHEQISRARNMTFKECLAMEYSVACQLLERQDVQDALAGSSAGGWEHTLEGVQDVDVSHFFEPSKVSADELLNLGGEQR
jgi:enoyl-CoA hydratase/carnithine racemase